MRIYRIESGDEAIIIAEDEAAIDADSDGDIYILVDEYVIKTDSEELSRILHEALEKMVME